MTRFAGKPIEPAEPDPRPGWLRSRFMGLRYPRPGVAPCGRLTCPVCAPCEQPEFIAEAIETKS